MQRAVPTFAGQRQDSDHADLQPADRLFSVWTRQCAESGNVTLSHAAQQASPNAPELPPSGTPIQHWLPLPDFVG